MKYAFCYKSNRESDIKVKDKIIAQLPVESKEDENDPDYVFILGGDGMFLSSIHKYINKLDSVIFVPINLSKIGYLLDFTVEDADNINSIIVNNPVTTKHLIEASFNEQSYYAVNEIVIGSIAKAGKYTISYGNRVESYVGSGIIVCTPLGSSGYCHSVGGKILKENDKTFEIAKIAPLVNKKSDTNKKPIIFDENHVVAIEQLNNCHQAIVYDNEYITTEKIDKIVIKKSSKTFKYITKNNMTQKARLKKVF